MHQKVLEKHSNKRKCKCADGTEKLSVYELINHTERLD